jgi:amino acid adenylation domain-containing protein
LERLSGHFTSLVSGVITDPDQSIARLPLLTEPEKQQMLVAWNDSGREYRRDYCIHQRFEAQAEETPQAPAVTCADRQISYGELNRRANQLARYLRGLGVGPEVLVGICLQRSVEMVIALLAVLKAGGAYVPLDPQYPSERLAFILNDADASVLLTEEHVGAHLQRPGMELVKLPQSWRSIEKESDANLENLASAENLAYVIYTSGSTGIPKGVAIRHASAAAFLTWIAQVFSRSEMAGVLASTSICFDLSVFEIFGTLSSGGQVIVAQNALALPALPAADQVTLINTVPSAIVELLRARALPPTVQTINLAGEPLKTNVVKEIHQVGSVRRVYDLYGPSEDTTYSTYALRSEDGPQTIGKPISNTQTYILDSLMQPVPIGVTGELYIAGAGLARGYLKRPELTAERFLPNPFGFEPGARLYQTGDLARYLPDGNIEFLGREDHQVKIRGFRIELGEIEVVLARHPAVREALVVAREEVSEAESSALGSDKRLVAYIVTGNGATPAVSELRNFVKNALPDYMVPSSFVFLAALPLTANGKIDRKALPAPDHQASAESVRNPRNPMEIALADIWSEVLEVSPVGMDDNFFDLGGHSLLAARLMARIKNELGTELPPSVLFEGPTVAQLAPKIYSKKQESIFHQREEGNYTHLFELQAGDKTKPIFCFPFRGGLDGEFFNFTRVARHFDSQYSFYGILSRGLDGTSEPRYSVQEMVADYIKEIRSVQPHGPYIFVGECQGGFVAYEAARQMLADGEEMGLLVLLDTQATLPARGFWRRCALPLKYRLGKSPAWRYFKTRYAHHIQTIRQQSATAALGYSVAKITRAVSTVPFLIGLEQSENPGRAVSDKDRLRVKVESLKRTFNLAIRRYELQPYAGRVTLLLNEQSHSANRMRDWTDYVGNALEVYKLPGGHDVCVPQNIPTVANILKECLAGIAKKV